MSENIATVNSDGKLIYYGVLKDMESKFEVFTDVVTSERYVVDINGETRQFKDNIDPILIDYFTEAYKQPPKWIPDIVKSFENKCINNRQDTHLRCAQIPSGDTSRIIYRMNCQETLDISNEGWFINDIHKSSVRFRDTVTNVDSIPPVDTEVKLDKMLVDLMPIFGKQELIPYMGALVTMFMENIATPLLNIHGDQGGFKTGLGATTKMLADPSTKRLVISGDSLSTSKKDMVLKMSSSSCILFDNLTRLTSMQSNVFARSVTGGFEAIRDLYTTRRMVNIPLKCAPIFAGISNVVGKSDLADRTVNLELERFEVFKSEQSVIDGIMNNIPETLGSIFNILVEVLDYTGEPINPLNLRLTDYSTITYLVGKYCGYTEEEITSALYINREINKRNVEDNSALITWVMDHVTEDTPWRGTPDELHTKMKVMSSTPYKTGVGVGMDLKDKQLSLFESGYVVEKMRRTSSKRGYEIRVRNPEDKYIPFKKSGE